MSALLRNPFLNRAYAAAAKILAGGIAASRWVFDQACEVLRTLRTIPWPVLRARLILGLTVMVISVFWGMATAVLEKNALYLAIGVILSVFILIDFRVGVITLILFLPFTNTKLFPHQLLGITGLNPLNLLMMATLFSYGVRRAFSNVRYRFVPREAWWLYIFPIACAAALGATHVGEIPSFITLALDISLDDPFSYLRDYLVRPMYSVLFALLVAAAVVETRRVEGFLIAGLISLWVILLTVIIFFLMSGASLSELSGAGGESRGFFNPLGLHANAVGRLFAVAFGILLFSGSFYKKFLPRIVVWGSAAVTALATLITFSRGSYLLLLIIGLLYLKSLKGRRRWQIMTLALPAILLAVPRAVYDRFLFGVSTGADFNTLSPRCAQKIQY